MQISKFVRELHSLQTDWVLATSPEEELYSFKPFPSETPLQKNILYIGRLSNLSKVPVTSTFNFLCINDLDKKYDSSLFRESFSNCNIIITNSPIYFRGLCDLASEIFLAETKYASYINHMVTVSNANKGLSYLVDEACKIMKSPIIIIDTSFKILAMYNGFAIDSRPDLESQRALGYLNEQTIQRMKKDKVYEKIRAKKYPDYDKSEGEEFGWMNYLVYMNGIEVAQIGMMEYDHPFTFYDYEFLNFLSQLVSWEMQKNDFYKNNRGIMHSVFLSELLDRKITNQRIVTLRKEQLKWAEMPCLYVFTIFDNEIGDFNQKAQIIIHQIQYLIPNSKYVIYDSKLVLLVQQMMEDTSIFKEDGPLADYLAANQLIGVVSNCFSNLVDIRRFYDQTLKTNDLIQISSEQKHIFFYSNYMFFHIGQIIAEKYDLKDFYHPAIIKMIQYDSKNQTCFIDTLYQYLLHCDNPTQCSANLYIHKNTFFYRLNKIRDLFSLDLSNGEVRLKLHLTLEFLKLEDISSTLKKGTITKH